MTVHTTVQKVQLPPQRFGTASVLVVTIYTFPYTTTSVRSATVPYAATSIRPVTAPIAVQPVI